MRLTLVPIALAGLILTGSPAFAQSAKSLPTDVNAPTPLLNFWRSHPAGTTLGNSPSETAPGVYPTAPSVFVHKVYGGAIPSAQADLLKRKLEIAFRALMSQPSLADIHGSSLTAAINITRTPTDDGEPVISASLSFNAKTIVKDDPKTIVKDARYVTPWQEGAVLEVILNPYGYIARRNVQPGPIAGRAMALNAGSTWGLFVSDKPISSWDYAATKAALATDESWIGRPGDHAMVVRVSGARHNNIDVDSGRSPPTDGLARLVAAAYMVDWQAVQQQMAAVR